MGFWTQTDFTIAKEQVYRRRDSNTNNVESVLTIETIQI